MEKRLREEVTCDLEFLSDVACHLMEAGGKRIRPALAIASASLGVGASDGASGAAISDDVISGATAVELVHLGSLYHDDVMDAASTRRSVSSVNDRWDNLTAILAGDFLLARASQIAARLGTEVAGLLAATIGKLCEGQIREHQDAFNADRSIESYEKSIEGKTAALLSASCRVGGIVANLPAAAQDALADFGHSYGMAFQIVDDVLDVVSTDEQIGKPVGADMAEGNYTLPVILTLLKPEGAQLRRILSDGSPLEPADFERAREIIAGAGGVKGSLLAAARWADRARAAAQALPRSPATDAMCAAASHLLCQAG